MLVGPAGSGRPKPRLPSLICSTVVTRNLITINMSEFQEAHTVSTLKGSPPGYVGYGEGGVLTEAVAAGGHIRWSSLMKSKKPIPM